MNPSKDLDLSNDDIENLSTVMDDLIDIVAKFNGMAEVTETDFSHLKAVIDFTNFVVSGIIYANGLDLTASHEHVVRFDDDEDDEDGVE